MGEVLYWFLLGSWYPEVVPKSPALVRYFPLRGGILTSISTRSSHLIVFPHFVSFLKFVAEFNCKLKFTEGKGKGVLNV